MGKEAKASPFPLQLEVEVMDRLAEPVREKKAKSVSEIIRVALERYDFENVVVVRPATLSISVRLPVEIRRTLKKVARAKHTSVGHLVRAAVESYLPLLESGEASQLEMPIEMPAQMPAAASGGTSQRRRRKPPKRPRAGRARSRQGRSRPKKT